MWTLFVRLRAADKVEAETGCLQESDINDAISEDLNESITEVLHKAGRHMEDTIGMQAEVLDICINAAYMGISTHFWPEQ